MSRVKPAKMLMMRSLPMTSEMLRVSVPADGLSSLGDSASLGGLMMLGMFMMGFWCLEPGEAGLMGLLRWKLGRTSRAVMLVKRMVAVRRINGVSDFIVVVQYMLMARS